MTFSECVLYCFDNREFVAAFDRLTNSNLSRRGPPVVLMVDDATGKPEQDMVRFIEFVMDVVWLRMPPLPEADESALEER